MKLCFAWYITGDSVSIHIQTPSPADHLSQWWDLCVPASQLFPWCCQDRRHFKTGSRRSCPTPGMFAEYQRDWRQGLGCQSSTRERTLPVCYGIYRTRLKPGWWEDTFNMLNSPQGDRTHPLPNLAHYIQYAEARDDVTRKAGKRSGWVQLYRNLVIFPTSGESRWRRTGAGCGHIKQWVRNLMELRNGTEDMR